jgi:hypothetical protein
MEEENPTNAPKGWSKGFAISAKEARGRSQPRSDRHRFMRTLPSDIAPDGMNRHLKSR